MMISRLTRPLAAFLVVLLTLPGFGYPSCTPQDETTAIQHVQMMSNDGMTMAGIDGAKHHQSANHHPVTQEQGRTTGTLCMDHPGGCECLQVHALTCIDDSTAFNRPSHNLVVAMALPACWISELTKPPPRSIS